MDNGEHVQIYVTRWVVLSIRGGATVKYSLICVLVGWCIPAALHTLVLIAASYEGLHSLAPVYGT